MLLQGSYFWVSPLASFPRKKQYSSFEILTVCNGRNMSKKLQYFESAWQKDRENEAGNTKASK